MYNCRTSARTFGFTLFVFNEQVLGLGLDSQSLGLDICVLDSITDAQCMWTVHVFVRMLACNLFVVLFVCAQLSEIRTSKIPSI